MKIRLVLLGAGKLGDAMPKLLFHCGDYQITVVDACAERLAQVERARRSNVRT
jgi:saccharopine dehydrogenase-like NADP-dependent oxidoreductase